MNIVRNKSVAKQSAWLLCYFPVALGLALLTPDSILEYSWANAYTQVIAKIIPFVANVGVWSHVPATQWIAAVLNVLAALWMYALFFDWNAATARINGMSWPERLKILASGIGALGLIYFFMFTGLVGPEDRRMQCMLSSKLGMGSYGAFLIVFQWMIAFVSIAHLLAIAKAVIRCDRMKSKRIEGD